MLFEQTRKLCVRASYA